ncbi:hypothetical protein FB567DRAFT_447301 [Paraphoma chrysanthemicola]|uniref:Uncharacterized protein n=1 Tax=Paraphoma chrysanthemicola TaxID=798071 RepID=A0A8K0VW91_9PLEO|nr:hypothetical protein FB567DRAFT_447301 [Paraphoma chrysanthemicola]
MRFLYVLLTLVLSAMAVRLGHQHGNAHHHGLELRAIVTEVQVVTVTQILTVTVGTDTSTSSATNTSSSTAPSSTSPHNNTTGGTHAFKSLDTIPDTVTLLNSCDYPVYLWSVGHNCDGTEAVGQLIAPHDTYKESIRRCEIGGIALKISRIMDALMPMQFEYTVWASDSSMLSYDIAYLDCLKNDHGQKDISPCAGAELGVQAVGDGDAKSFRCGAGEWCSVQAYVVPAFDYQAGAPVGGCKVHHDVAFELCAGNR